MSERPRFFNFDQKKEHAENIGGWKCEGMIDPYTPCNEVILESHHGVSFSRGGETVEDNQFFFGKVCHAIMHILAGESWAARLIEKRMDYNELNELHKRGY
jgi:hypothetical protein